ncbi:CLUMA_CG008287, isoform A [Clunio marinus]|uniref:CLUMA_CG008287, isoform A n=1 Tax=Clunio marinus TaxID=568069 RepID=A0A1J1I8Q0_9DIPT|nr:CLUMA_CG008287, isoform A [Clunio marinus]
MNDSLKLVNEWAIKNMVQINPSKSQKLNINLPPITINNEILNYTDNLKILGLIIDSSLAWDGQISKLCGEIYGTLSMLRQTQSLIHLNLKMHLIKSLIVPKFMYCSEIYMGCSRSNWHKLNKTPTYIFEKLHLPRIPRNRLLNLPPSKCSKQHMNGFFVRGPRLWNSLPVGLRMLDSMSAFKQSCLTYFASQKTQN